MRTIKVLIALLLLASIAGCGSTTSTGGGGGGGGQNPFVSLTAAKANIAPGESVTLSWSSQNADHVDSSNFGVNTLSGTVQANPSVTTAYSLTVSGPNGPPATASVTITVTGTGERYVLVGDQTNAEVPQILAKLQQLGSVAVQMTVPTTGSSFDAVVIHESGTLSPAAAPTVKGLLDQGKGVVLLNSAPLLLATGNPNNPDVSAIGSWFGGVTKMDGNPSGQFSSDGNIRSNQGLVPVPIPLLGAPVYGADSALVANSVGPATDVVALDGYHHISAFGFVPPTGGRVYFQNHPYGTDLRVQANTVQLFQVGARWAATGK